MTRISSSPQGRLKDKHAPRTERIAALGSSSAKVDTVPTVLPCRGATTPEAGGRLEIRWVELDQLRPYARNARAHGEKQLALLTANIRRFGFLVPVLVDEQFNVLAGHGRIEAARRLGWAEVPTIRVGHLTEPEKRAVRLADNRLAELATWNVEVLKLELQDLVLLPGDFAIELTGFETVDIDRLLADPGEAKADSADDSPAPEKHAVSRPGDLWILGRHRLLCGDALKDEAYRHLLGEERAQMVFVDPPYNVPVQGHVGGRGRIQHREFAMASGEMSEENFLAFLGRSFRNLAAYTGDGSIHYVCMDWRHIDQVIAAGRPVYGAPKNLCVWDKTNAGQGSFYRSQHELVAVFKNGTVQHINNFGLGECGRYRTNVWRYPGVNTFRRGRMEELGMHPTVKPVALVADAIKDCSHRNGIVLDAFAGSGTTIIAAERTGRTAHAIELDPLYVDVAVRRWQTFTGQAARLDTTGQAWDAARRTRTPELSSNQEGDHA